VAPRDVPPEADPIAGVSDAEWVRLCRLAFRFLWNRADAEDAVQEALQAAHLHRQQLADGTKWWPWLRRITIQKCHQIGRRKRRDRTVAMPAQFEVAADSEDGDHLAESEATRLALDRLPQRQREVVVLRHLEGMGYDEIAVILDIAPSTARVHARAALEALRDHLVQQHPDWFDRQPKK